MDDKTVIEQDVRQPVLNPVERISEMLFGLFMALTFVGAVSAATTGREEIGTMFAAALGCNLAWGLVDAVMYLVRALTERTRNRSLARQVTGAETATAHRLIGETLPEHVAAITGPDELEGMRRRLLASSVPDSAGLRAEDYLAALGVFLLVVLATFPVVVPFLLIGEPALAMRVSRVVSLGMLFVAGYALGRYAGHPHPARTGLLMLLLGAALVVAVMALGG